MKDKQNTEQLKKIEENTIMPDGRPFFAWENELKMLRNSEPELGKLRGELKKQWEVLKIAEIETTNEPTTMDLIIRIRFDRAVTNTESTFRLDKNYEVDKRLTKTTPSHDEIKREAFEKCIDIAENGDYTMFIKNDLHSIMALDEATAIRKQARKEVADKIKEYLFRRSLPTEE